jgi:hypothetical protein
MPLIPLSVLALDLPVPGEGWSIHLHSRGVEIVTDDHGRASVAPGDARRLFAECREAEARSREHAAAVEGQAIEQDRLRRAQLGRGVPASMIPAGMAPAAAMFAAELDSQTYRPRT